MPELPEVESSRRMLLEHCKGATVVDVTAAEDAIVIVDCTSRELESALKGATVVELHRRGKHLWWELDGGKKSVLFHFGMTGSFVVRGKAATKYKSFSVDGEQWPPRFHKLLVTLSTGVEVAFVDSRRFARIRMAADPLSVSPICDLGPDPILSPPSAQQWADAVRKRTGAIKGVLLDQSIACGVGNWVADEILFQARVHPETPASALSAEEVESLRKAMLDVCNLAVSVGADDERFPRDWLFHTRWHKTGGKVLGHSVSYITVNGRTSAFVPALQKKKGGSGGGGASGSKGRKRGPPEEAPGEDPHADGEGDGEGGGAKRKKATAGGKAGAKRARGAKKEEAAEEGEPAGTSGGVKAEPVAAAAAAGKRGRGGGATKQEEATAATAAAEITGETSAPAAKKGRGSAAAAAGAGADAGRKRKAPAAPAPAAAKTVSAKAKAAEGSGGKPQRRTRGAGAAAEPAA